MHNRRERKQEEENGPHGYRKDNHARRFMSVQSICLNMLTDRIGRRRAQGHKGQAGALGLLQDVSIDNLAQSTGNSLQASTLLRHHTSHQETVTSPSEESITNLTALGRVKDGEEWRPGRQRWHSPGILRLPDHKRVANDSQTDRSSITNTSDI